MTDKLRLGAGSGYWGAALAPAVAVARDGDLDYLCFDLLAELTMSLLARQRLKDPNRGYIGDIIGHMDELMPLVRDSRLRVVTNGGGTNCRQAITDIAARAKAAGQTGVTLAAVMGDDVSDKIDPLLAEGWTFANLDTGEEDVGRVRERMVSAHAYIGADGIIEALEREADIVVCGRVSDNALYVGPMMHGFGWGFDRDAERIGAAITIGHLVECAELCCGAMSNFWPVAPDPWNVGNPIAEVYADGSAVIEKLPGTGGMLNSWTLKEHLVYEVHDPENYYMPDGIGDLTKVRLDDLGPDRVRVSNATGKARPDTLKVQLGYNDGYIAEAMFIQTAPFVLKKTAFMIEVFKKRLAAAGIVPKEMRFDRVGLDALSGPMFEDPPEDQVREIGLRLAVRTETRAEAAKARAEMVLVALDGPMGVAWGAPAAVRPVISLWPTLIPRDAVDSVVETLEVR